MTETTSALPGIENAFNAIIHNFVIWDIADSCETVFKPTHKSFWNLTT
jgi:hypothetical protein